jgi:hypothetical protein
MFRKKEKSEVDNLTEMISKFVLTLSGVALLILFGFRIGPYGEQLKINDMLGYTASFGGAILSSMTSLIILYVTFKQTRKIQEENQRQTFISNTNEKIKDHREILEKVNDNLKSIKTIRFNCMADSQKALNYTTNYEKIYQEFIGISDMYLSEDIVEKSHWILNYYNDAFARRTDILKKVASNIHYDYANELKDFIYLVDQIILGLEQFSNMLHNNILNLYNEKYNKLDFN